jgi:hypothetical protein
MVPFELRAKMAHDAHFASAVRNALHASLQRAYERRARDFGGTPNGRTGGVTAVQRFFSGLNLHVHLHALVLDGVFDRGEQDSVRFRSEENLRLCDRNYGSVFAFMLPISPHHTLCSRSGEDVGDALRALFAGDEVCVVRGFERRIESVDQRHEDREEREVG